MLASSEDAERYLAEGRTLFGPGWTAVESFDDLSDGEDFEEEEEEIYVTMDLGTSIDNKVLMTENQYQLIGLDTPLPFFKLGNQVFKGEVTPLIGTDVILGLIRNHENPQQPSHPPIHATSHRLTFQAVDLRPKNDTKDNSVENTENTAPESPPIKPLFAPQLVYRATLTSKGPKRNRRVGSKNAASEADDEVDNRPQNNERGSEPLNAEAGPSNRSPTLDSVDPSSADLTKSASSRTTVFNKDISDLANLAMSGDANDVHVEYDAYSEIQAAAAGLSGTAGGMKRLTKKQEERLLLGLPIIGRGSRGGGTGTWRGGRGGKTGGALVVQGEKKKKGRKNISIGQFVGVEKSTGGNEGEYDEDQGHGGDVAEAEVQDGDIGERMEGVVNMNALRDEAAPTDPGGGTNATIANVQPSENRMEDERDA